MNGTWRVLTDAEIAGSIAAEGILMTEAVG